MGSKIRPPGTSMGPFFFKNMVLWWVYFSKFSKICAKMGKFGTLIGQLFKIFRNLRQNGANFSEKFWFLVHGWVTFPSKWVHGWVAFQKSQRHTPTQTKVEYPPGGIWISLFVLVGLSYSKENFKINQYWISADSASACSVWFFVNSIISIIPRASHRPLYCVFI